MTGIKWNGNVLCARPSGISPALRKTALKLKLKKVIEESGDVCRIKTKSAFRNYTVSFTLGQPFEEVTRGLDNQHLKSMVTWDGDRLVCEQNGLKLDRGWAHWIEDDKLYLEMYCEGQICKQIFKRKVSKWRSGTASLIPGEEKRFLWQSRRQLLNCDVICSMVTRWQCCVSGACDCAPPPQSSGCSCFCVECHIRLTYIIFDISIFLVHLV